MSTPRLEGCGTELRTTEAADAASMWLQEVTKRCEDQLAEWERQDRAMHPESYPRPTSFYFFGASGPRTEAGK